MRITLNRLWTLAGVAIATVLVNAQPLFAQDASESAKTTSAFKQFFLPGDVMGLIITWLLIIMSVCVMALMIKGIMDNRADNLIPPDSILELEELLVEKRFREAIERAATDESMFGKIIHASLSEAGNGFGAMERAVEETADTLGSKRVRSLEILNVLGAIGPMIGLFGTVYGMIAAFQTIVDKGGQPDPSDLAAGISTALVTTFWGLVVGIPAVASAALIRNKIDGMTVEIMIQAEMLISQFQPGKKPAPGAGGGSSSGGGSSKASPKPHPQ